MGEGAGGLKRGIGTFQTKDGRNQIQFLEELGDSDWNELRSALDRLLVLETSFHAQLLERNYRDFRNLFEFMRTAFVLGRRYSANLDRRNVLRTVVAALVNVVFSARLFLDHEEATLKRRFGQDSAELARFIEATHQSYDAHYGYRLIYHLRNYIVHVGMPNINVGVSVQDNEPVLQFCMYRSNLLSSYDDGWKSAKQDLLNGPEEIPIAAITANAMVGLRKVSRECVDILIDDALAAAPLVASHLRRYPSVASAPDTMMLMTVDELPDDRITFQQSSFSKSTVDLLCQMARGERDRNELHAPRDDDDDVPLHPAVVARGDAGRQRGKEILTLHLSSEWSRQHLAGLVNGIVQRDGSYQPLIDDLVNLAMLYGHLAAAAIGEPLAALVAHTDGAYSAAAREARDSPDSADDTPQ